MNPDPRVTLALTGASGMPYALTLLRALLERDQQVLLLLSEAAREVLHCEMQVELPEDPAAARDILLRLAARTGRAPGSVHATSIDSLSHAVVTRGAGAPANQSGARQGAGIERSPATLVDAFLDAHRDQLRLLGNREWTASPASGSGAPRRMVICPCSMGTLAGIATGLSNNLIERAADVAIKEGHRLIVLPREMPLSALHLENMARLARLGVTVMPPCPAFYQQPATLQDLVDFVVDRVLAQLGLPGLLPGWDAPAAG